MLSDQVQILKGPPRTGVISYLSTRFLLAPVLLLSGCHLLSPSQKQDVSPVQEIKQAVDALVAQVENVQSTVTNDIWPWVVLLGLLMALPIIGFLIWYWIKSYSYLNQKPKYEAVKRGIINGLIDNSGHTSLQDMAGYSGDPSHSGFIQEGNLRPGRGLHLDR